MSHKRDSSQFNWKQSNATCWIKTCGCKLVAHVSFVVIAILCGWFCIFKCSRLKTWSQVSIYFHWTQGYYAHWCFFSFSLSMCFDFIHMYDSTFNLFFSSDKCLPSKNKMEQENENTVLWAMKIKKSTLGITEYTNVGFHNLNSISAMNQFCASIKS